MGSIWAFIVTYDSSAVLFIEKKIKVSQQI